MQPDHCAWCGLRIDDAEIAQTFNSGHEQRVHFCSGDCLFQQLLNDRCDNETYWKVLELIHIGSANPR